MAIADVMISDFSSITFDFFLLFKKPILTVLSQYEKRGREAFDLSGEPWDLFLLNKIGKTLTDDDIGDITKLIDESILNYSFSDKEVDEVKKIADNYPTESANRGLDFIEEILNNVKKKVDDLQRIKIIEKGLFKEMLSFEDSKNTFIFFINFFLNPLILFQISFSLLLLNSYIFVSLRILPNFGLSFEYILKLKPYILFISLIFFCLFLFSIWFKSEKSSYIVRKKKK